MDRKRERNYMGTESESVKTDGAECYSLDSLRMESLRRGSKWISMAG